MITIRDLLIAPFEIDVDERNFILVKSSINDETGKTYRKVQGYYHLLATCLDVILKMKVRDHAPDLEGRVVTLKEFLQSEYDYKEQLRKWMMHLAKPAIFDESGDVPLITPKQFIVDSAADTTKPIMDTTPSVTHKFKKSKRGYGLKSKK